VRGTRCRATERKRWKGLFSNQMIPDRLLPWSQMRRGRNDHRSDLAMGHVWVVWVDRPCGFCIPWGVRPDGMCPSWPRDGGGQFDGPSQTRPGSGCVGVEVGVGVWVCGRASGWVCGSSLPPFSSPFTGSKKVGT